MGAGRRRGRDPRGPRQHAGGALDGDAELPATIPGSEQNIPLSIHSNVRVGLQRQAGDRGVRAGTVGRAVRHHLPYMSRVAFVTTLYGDILGRAAEATGVRFWMGRMEVGAKVVNITRQVWTSVEHRTL